MKNSRLRLLGITLLAFSTVLILFALTLLPAQETQEGYYMMSGVFSLMGFYCIFGSRYA